MSLGEVDTLNLLTDKLDNLFNESQEYYETFLDANNLYKQGKLTDKEFFQKLGDYVVAYSALEFLSIKVIFEMKKSIDKIAGGSAPGGTQSPGLMPGMGSPGMMMDTAMFGGFMPPGGGGAFAGEGEMTEELGCIEVAAMGYQDKIPSWQPVRDFRDALRSSPLFAEETEITWTPPANDMARQFKIEIQLNDPLPR